ncbi:MAG TPA: alpha/beta hydrolase [Acidimicrobiales bacterium]|nr:alpha/beta hydrolase [Acidimicrobiales bacterium]
MSAVEVIAEWEANGNLVQLGDDEVFVVDVDAEHPGDAPPLLVLHGFPTSSIDFAEVLPALRAGRRVVLLDLPGYGQSAKPDRAYSLFAAADLVDALLERLGIDEVDLLTHDMGDSVGGELLARSIDGTLGFSIRNRVLSNGSIYLELAHLTPGQQFLMSLPDEAVGPDAAPDVDALVAALTATFAPPDSVASHPDVDHVRAAADLIVASGGNRLLPRLIRYIEERRVHEGRWTGAIERHRAPLTIVWGDRDPIAVWQMTARLVERRPDATLTRLEGVGHYPMIEAPDEFAKAVLAGL